MSDSEKREKVIRGLECHATKGFVACQDCPYYPDELIYEDDDDTEGTICEEKLAADAIALLREQEPRVLEYPEIEKYPLVFLEDNDKEDVIPALFLQYNGWNAEFAVQAPDECVDTIIRSSIVIAVEGMYGITWRAWTARPTDEQRKAAKWE